MFKLNIVDTIQINFGKRYRDNPYYKDIPGGR